MRREVNTGCIQTGATLDPRAHVGNAEQDAEQDIGHLEALLIQAVERMSGEGCARRLGDALRRAVLPGGSRIRPQLCMAVGRAVGTGNRSILHAVAAAIEILHCASLVHDDLPCFDNASVRRGLPSVHRASGEAIAVLCGDALIVGAFEILSDAAALDARRVVLLVGMLARATGAPEGLAAGQGWESEQSVNIMDYHHAKTAALFEAATMCGALAMGADPLLWQSLGRWIGHAYQIIDDIRDHLGIAAVLGKPVGQDEVLQRPSVVGSLGLDASVAMFERARAQAFASIAPCSGAKHLQRFVQELFERVHP